MDNYSMATSNETLPSIDLTTRSHSLQTSDLSHASHTRRIPYYSGALLLGIPLSVSLEKDIDTLQYTISTYGKPDWMQVLSVVLQEAVSTIKLNEERKRKSFAVGQVRPCYSTIQLTHLENCRPFCSMSTPKRLGRPRCEACEGPALFACKRCKNSFYCSKDHILGDSVHVLMCDLILYIRSESKFIMKREDREKIEKMTNIKRHSMVTRLMLIGRHSMVAELYIEANQALLQAVKCANKIYGYTHTTLAELYILKSECHTICRDYRSAISELGAARACMDEHEMDDDLEADMALRYGLVYIMVGDWKMAAEYISNAIILVSMMYGPNSMKTSRCYFHMGEIFAGQGKMQVAESFFEHSIQNYLGWMSVIFHEYYNSSDLVMLPVQFEGDSIVRVKKLTDIFSQRNDAVAFAKCLVTFSLIALFRGKRDESYRFTKKAKACLSGKTDENLNHLIKAIQRDIARCMRKNRKSMIFTDVDMANQREKARKADNLVNLFETQGVKFGCELDLGTQTKHELADEVSMSDPFVEMRSRKKRPTLTFRRYTQL